MEDDSIVPIPPHLQWFDREEEYLTYLKNACSELSQVYMDLYLRTHKVQTKLRLPVIALSSCSGVASFGSSAFTPLIMKYISIGVGVVNVFIAIVQTYESYLKIGDIVSKSLSVSQSLKKLADHIECEIFIPIQDRESNGVTYLRECFSRYQAIMDQAPPLESLDDSQFSVQHKAIVRRLTNEIKKRITQTGGMSDTAYASRPRNSIVLSDVGVHVPTPVATPSIPVSRQAGS